MARKITGRTKLVGLLGNPVEHSLSPMIQNAAFEELGLDYAYLAFQVGTEDLKTAVDGLKVLGVRGFNLTMPTKSLMCELADQLSPAAQIIGAVNVIVNEDGIYKGYNTDGIGFMRSVKEEIDIVGKKMTLMGAGGAAASILVQAALDGVGEISVFSRRGKFYERAEGIIAALKKQTKCVIHLYDFTDTERFKKEIAESEILVNGTSVGMAPNVDQCIIEDERIFRKDLYVYDVIYNPRETLLLKKAREAGCRTQNGLNMLLYQGAAAFELWTGRQMPVDVIREKFFQC